MPSGTDREAVCAEVVRLIIEARKRQGISMNQLAAQAGLSQSMISRLESDPRNPTLDSLLRISEVLGVNLGTVLTEAIESIQGAETAKSPESKSSGRSKRA